MPTMLPVPLLNRPRPSRLRRRQDQEDREDQLRLSRLEDLEVQGRPLDQVGLDRTLPIQALR
jgi:hypothetical protein